jgi:hypothetical protein
MSTFINKKFASFRVFPRLSASFRVFPRLSASFRCFFVLPLLF